MKGIRTLGLLIFTYLIVTVYCKSEKPEIKLSDIKHECSAVADLFSALNIGHSNLVPDSKIHDGEMEICYKGSTETEKTSCCTRKMERKYHVAATKDFSDTVRQSSFFLKDTLQARAAKFQDEFLSLINQAKNATLGIFNKDFAIPVSDRRGPLDNFFMDLSAYIKQREVDLHDTVSTFFNEMFPPVVQYLLIDPSKLLVDDDYRDCLMSVRQSLIPRPFGDIPNNMAVDLTRSLGLARLYLEAIGIGIEAVNTTDHLPLDLQCQRGVTRLTYCAHCSGGDEAVNVRPCRGYCHNVMRGCMAGVTQLDAAWNDYVDALAALTKAANKTLDIGEVMGRLHAQISDGVMHAMHSSHKYYSKMIARCEEPKSITDDSSDAAANTPRSSSTQTSTKLPTTPLNAPTLRDQELYKQMESFMSSVSASKGFYHTLADAVCTSERYSARENEPCWNGREVGTYTADVPKAAFEMQSKNPEIKVPNVKPQALVSLADKLAHIKKKLNKKFSTTPLSQSAGKISLDDQMQADGGWNDENDYYGYGSGHSSKDSNYGGGYYGNTVDDEDYSDEDMSGSGSGGYPSYNRKNPPYKTPQRGGHHNKPDDDMYIDDNDKQAYIKQPNSDSNNVDGASGAATPTVTSAIVCSLVFSLYVWING